MIRNRAELTAMNVDIGMLRQQRDDLLQMEDNRHPDEIATLEGVINMIDAMLDRYDDSTSIRQAPSGASGTLHDRCDEEVKTQGEVDPDGLDQHQTGAKLDQDKLRPALVLGNFSCALEAVTAVGTYGANKYSDNGWKDVSNGIERYHDAAMRHWLKYQQGERINEEDGGVEHLAQVIWNLCSVYELEHK